MILFPAVDIQGGKVVRLHQGKFSQVTQYADDPVEMALKWESMGAQWLHLVDLDGAKTGVMMNQEAIIKIARTVKIPVQVGGGVRDEQTVDQLIKGNVSRIIIGTKALDDSDLLTSLLAKHGKKICVSLDCSNGFVAARGWRSTSNVKAVDLARELEQLGLQWIVYTDIARDGTLAGPNYEGIQTMLDAVKIPLIASGGIATIEDVKRLATMKGVAGAITGKAIYEGRLDFKEALKLC